MRLNYADDIQGNGMVVSPTVTIVGSFSLADSGFNIASVQKRGTLQLCPNDEYF